MWKSFKNSKNIFSKNTNLLVANKSLRTTRLWNVNLLRISLWTFTCSFGGCFHDDVMRPAIDQLLGVLFRVTGDLRMEISLISRTRWNVTAGKHEMSASFRFVNSSRRFDSLTSISDNYIFIRSKLKKNQNHLKWWVIKSVCFIFQLSPYDNLLLCQPVSSPLPLRLVQSQLYS